MIKVFSISIFLFLCSCSRTKWDTRTLQTLLTDFERHSYFVDVRVKEKETINRYLITNNDLYHYFKAKYGFKSRQYVDHMMPILTNDQAMEIDSLSLIDLQFSRVDRKCSDINEDTDNLLDRYFHKVSTNYVINEDIAWIDQYCLIDALFRNGVIVRTDDESGYLMVPDQQFNNKKQ